jgi:hypothetical protein
MIPGNIKSIERKLTIKFFALTIPMTCAWNTPRSKAIKVYAFDGTTYRGYSGTSDKDGQVIFTLPQGNYPFRGDLNGIQFWSSTENAALCLVEIPAAARWP